MPVLLEGLAAEEDGEKDDQVGDADQEPADFDAVFEIVELVSFGDSQ